MHASDFIFKSPFESGFLQSLYQPRSKQRYPQTKCTQAHSQLTDTPSTLSQAVLKDENNRIKGYCKLIIQMSVMEE